MKDVYSGRGEGACYGHGLTTMNITLNYSEIARDKVTLPRGSGQLARGSGEGVTGY